MIDLFANDFEPIVVPLIGADLTYYPTFDAGIEKNIILSSLINETPWREEEITVWGKKFLQPRLIAWYGDPEFNYTYSGIHLKPLPWTRQLEIIRRKVEAETKTHFNSVLLNYYRNGKDSMGFHSDNERELGSNPVIASYSIGEPRTLIFKPKFDKSIKSKKLSLQSGSLLIMAGATQENWLHGIEKTADKLGARINLTFRQIKTSLYKIN